MERERFRVLVADAADDDRLRINEPARSRITRALTLLETDPYWGVELTGIVPGGYVATIDDPGGDYFVAYRLDEAQRLAVVFAIGPQVGFFATVRRRFQAMQRNGKEDRR